MAVAPAICGRSTSLSIPKLLRSSTRSRYFRTSLFMATAMLVDAGASLLRLALRSATLLPVSVTAVAVTVAASTVAVATMAISRRPEPAVDGDCVSASRDACARLARGTGVLESSRTSFGTDMKRPLGTNERQMPASKMRSRVIVARIERPGNSCKKTIHPENETGEEIKDGVHSMYASDALKRDLCSLVSET